MANKTPKVLRITDRPEYAYELAKLDRVNLALEAASKRYDKLLNTGRHSQEVMQYLSRGAHPMRGIEDTDLDQMALEVAAQGEITEQFAKRLRAGAPAVPLPDRYDVEAVEVINDAARLFHLLKRAFVLQTLRVKEQKNLAMADVCKASRGERERIAREVASSALHLIRVVEEETAFLEQLKSQDEALPTMLRPGAFPIPLRPDSPVGSYLRQALGISEAEIQRLMTNPGLEGRKAGAVQ